MISRSFPFALGVIFLGTTTFAQAPVDSPVPADTEIRQILADRTGGENLGIGMVVGVIDQKGRRVVSYGSLAKDDKRPLNGDTVFEIGSMTKVFTSLVLMDMVQRGEVALTDPVSKYLPPNAKAPERNNRKITLQDLSTQSSGLPRMPSNFNPKDALNPYADYSVEQMYQFLSGYQLTRDIGEKYEYSNLGVGLLGHVLSLRAGMDYEALVRSRICEPLGMTSTRVTLSPEMKLRLAIGHSATLNAVPNWDLPTLAGAGALRSSANDLLTFLAANLGYVKTPLAAAMAAEVSIRRPTGGPHMEIAYGWHIQTKDGKSIIWHNGGTGGYRTYMGYDPKRRAGVVVLSNISTAEGPDDIGRYLLDAGATRWGRTPFWQSRATAISFTCSLRDSRSSSCSPKANGSSSSRWSTLKSPSIPILRVKRRKQSCTRAGGTGWLSGLTRLRPNWPRFKRRRGLMQWRKESRTKRSHPARRRRFAVPLTSSGLGSPNTN